MSEEMVTIPKLEYDRLRDQEAMFAGYKMAVEALASHSHPNHAQMDWWGTDARSIPASPRA